MALAFSVPDQAPPGPAVYESTGLVLSDDGADAVVHLGCNVSSGEGVALQFLRDDAHCEMTLRTHLHLGEHPNIQRVLDGPLQGEGDCQYRSILVLQLCKGGTLLDYMARTPFLQESDIRCVMRQLFRALAHAHAVGVVHRDVRLENVLVAEDGSIKLAAWGSAGHCDPGGDSHTLQGIVGSLHYCAPEMLSDATACYGPEVDAWASGILLYTMLTGTFPWHGSTVSEIRMAILRFRYRPLTSTLSAECRDLVRQLLRLDASKRICIKDTLQHPWFTAC